MDMDPNTTFTTPGQVYFNITDVIANKSCSFKIQMYIFEPWVKAVFISLYVIIFVVGVGGNLAVLAVVLGNKHMRTPINLYLVNLAAADLIMCFTANIFTPLNEFMRGMGHRVLGEALALCKLIPSCMHVTVYMSTFTLTVVSVQRYRAVFYPFSTKANSLAKTVFIIIFIDLLAIIFTLPYTWSMVVVTDPYGKPDCIENWPHGLDGWMYGLFTYVIQFIIPFTTIVICYTRIMTHLRKRAIGGRSESMTTHQILEETAKITRMNKMLISIAVIFGICWFPINLFNLVFDILELIINAHCWGLKFLTFFIVHVIAMSSTCYNPFLYGLLNPAFREEFAKLRPSCVLKTRL